MKPLPIIHKEFATLPSTNTYGKEHAEQFDKQALTVISAIEQTKGRGRYNRSWVSSPKEISLTLCFFLPSLTEELGQIPQVLAVTVVQLLQALSFQPELKWPNDILLANKKLGGILSETTASQEGIFFILGIGINCNLPKHLLQQIDQPATSLAVEANKSFDFREIQEKLIARFRENLLLFFDKGFAPFLDSFNSAMTFGRNRLITWQDGHRTAVGRVLSLNANGSLNLELEDGTTLRCLSGELLFS